jgi:DNA-binding transcriptional LysR family regulator
VHPNTINGLLTFLAVAEHGSINRAAVTLNLSQPALTRTLQQLEGRLGSKLLTRSSRGVELTELGRVLAERARAIQHAVRAAEGDIRSYHSQANTTLDVGVVMVHPLQPFRHALVETVGGSAGCRVRLTFGTAAEMMDLLRAGRVEVVLGHLLEGHEASDLVQDQLALDEVAIYARARHPLAGRADLMLAELGVQRWALGPREDALGGVVHRIFEAGGVPGPDVAIETDLTPLRRAIVIGSDLLSVFQLHHVAHEVAAGRLVKLAYDLGVAGRPIGMIRIGRHSRMSAGFLAALSRHYREAEL